jgi:hypothetical protein
LPRPVFIGPFRRPIGQGIPVAQLVDRVADHGTEGRVGIGDPTAQVARAQTGHQRVLHRLAKRQCLGQCCFGACPPAHVAHQQQHHAEQHARQTQHERRRQVRDQPRAALGRVGAQQQRLSRQFDQALGAKDAGASQDAGAGQARSVTVDERQFVADVARRAPRIVEPAPDQHAGDDEATAATGRLDRHAQVDHFLAIPCATGTK